MKSIPVGPPIASAKEERAELECLARPAKTEHQLRYGAVHPGCARLAGFHGIRTQEWTADWRCLDRDWGSFLLLNSSQGRTTAFDPRLFGIVQKSKMLLKDSVFGAEP